MSTVTVEPFTDVAAWSPRHPDGGASTAIAITAGGPPRGPWRDTPTARVSVTEDALGHHLDRSGPAVDLRPFADLVLWVRADRPADGSPARPFFAELRLGSAATPPGSAGNDWHRFLDVTTPGQWQQVPVSLADLPGQVRQAVTTVRLSCVDAERAWTLDLDRILAVREELLADTDDALRGLLDDRLTLDGSPVPAIVLPSASLPAGPHFRLANYDVRPDLGRAPGGRRRTDHTRNGFSLRPAAEPFAVHYTVGAVASERSQAVALLDFAVAQLVPTATLESGARVVTVDWVDPPLWASPASQPTTHPVLHLRVATGRTPAAAPEPAVPIFNVVDVEVEQRV